jgi:hypothetical protein
MYVELRRTVQLFGLQNAHSPNDNGQKANCPLSIVIAPRPKTMTFFGDQV